MEMIFMVVFIFVMCSFLHLVIRVLKEDLEEEWIPAYTPPKDERYILLSFENLPHVWIGRYKEDIEGGAYIYGETNHAAIKAGLVVNAWKPLPVPYVEEEYEERK